MAGFWTKTGDGTPVHINGDPNMSEETKQALMALMEAIAANYRRERTAFEQLWSQDVKVNMRTEEDKEWAFYWFDLGAGWHDHVTRKPDAKI